MNRSESIAKIASALVKAQSIMGNAIKDAKNPFFKSSYANLNAVREAVLPAMNANGISVLQPTVHIDGKSFVETMLLHESGEFISSLTEIIVAKTNDAQQQGSGISYARRYGLQSLANIGSDDDDGETAVGRGGSKTAPSSAQVAKVSANNLDKLEQSAVQSTPEVSRGSFRKNSAKATNAIASASSEATIPAGDL
jgi:hypothetical protein